MVTKLTGLSRLNYRFIISGSHSWGWIVASQGQAGLFTATIISNTNENEGKTGTKKKIRCLEVGSMKEQIPLIVLYTENLTFQASSPSSDH